MKFYFRALGGRLLTHAGIVIRNVGTDIETQNARVNHWTTLLCMITLQIQLISFVFLDFKNKIRTWMHVRKRCVWGQGPPGPVVTCNICLFFLFF